MPATLSFSLSEDTLKRVDRQVASGPLKTRDEVVDLAVHLLDYLTNMRRLRAALKEGEADIAAGRFTEIKDEKELKDFFASL